MASNATARMLLQEAYNIKAYQLSGGPGWSESDRYDIEAKAQGGATEDEMRPMLQRLLAERFKLIVHRQAKEMQVMLITAAKNGFKLHELKPGDPEPAPAPPKEGLSARSSGPVPLRPRVHPDRTHGRARAR